MFVVHHFQDTRFKGAPNITNVWKYLYINADMISLSLIGAHVYKRAYDIGLESDIFPVSSRKNTI